IRPASSDKEMELWVELKRMYEPDPKDQLWTLTQNYIHAPIEWKLYDLSGVHHVTAKEKEIFMLVEKDYPLRRGLALVLISYRLQVENHSQMAEDLIKKIYNIANTLRKQNSLGIFKGKVDEGFLVGYSVSSKAFKVFYSRICIVQETLHVNFLENKPNIAEKAREEGDQQYVLFPVWSSGSTNPQNNDGDAAFFEKEPKFDAKKPESKVNVSLSSIAQSKKQNDKTKRDNKGKSPVESSTGYRDLSAEFRDYSHNSNNEVNAAGTLVPTVGKISPYSTNTFSFAGNTFSAPEDITYSDDEDDVGAEADFNNLETSIIVSLIPTTRVYKDHLMTQIIGDLSSATQTRSMTRVAKDQVARIEAIRLFLAYASFMGFMVYQMDVKSAFLYGTIEEEVYV
nr:retrovirus-related Pol polyprotein from transposon TNT 1-94 [Tanacetum cinerariifolium]